MIARRQALAVETQCARMFTAQDHDATRQHFLALFAVPVECYLSPDTLSGGRGGFLAFSAPAAIRNIVPERVALVEKADSFSSYGKRVFG